MALTQPEGNKFTHMGIVVDDQIGDNTAKGRVYCPQIGVLMISTKCWVESIRIGDFIAFTKEILPENSRTANRSIFIVNSLMNHGPFFELQDDLSDRPYKNFGWLIKVDAVALRVDRNCAWLWNDFIGRIFLRHDGIGLRLKAFDVVDLSASFNYERQETPWNVKKWVIVGNNDVRKNSISQLLLTSDNWQICWIKPETKQFVGILKHTSQRNNSQAYANYSDISVPGEDKLGMYVRCRVTCIRQVQEGKTQPFRAVLVTPIAAGHDYDFRSLHPLHPGSGIISSTFMETCKQNMLNKKTLENAFRTKWTTVGQIHFNEHIILGYGFGTTVYEGLYQGEQVAIKRVIRRELKPYDEDFKNVAKSLIRVSHPNIIALKHIEDSDPIYLCLVLERCTCALNQFIEEDTWQAEFAEICYYELLRQAAVSLDVIHQHGIIHVDIKPQNFLLVKCIEKEGQAIIKLCDFENSKLMKEAKGFVTLTGTTGTLGYMAPEIREKSDPREITPKCDIYSFAGVIYYTLNGGTSPLGTIGRREIHETKRNGHYPAAILLTNMWAADPHYRLSAKEIIQHPGLWGKRKQHDFLKEVAEFVNNHLAPEIRQNPLKLYSDNNREVEDAITTNWIRVISNRLPEVPWFKGNIVYIPKKNGHVEEDYYDEKNLFQLLRAIRNKSIHEPYYENLLSEKIPLLFPKLLLLVYNKMLPYIEYLPDQLIEKYFQYGQKIRNQRNLHRQAMAIENIPPE